jgi:hypothetical protein
MNTGMNDTSIAAERVQIELLQSAGPSRRLGLMLNISASVLDLARRAISSRHVEWSNSEINIEFVKLNYGEGLAGKVRQYLEARTYGR